MIVGRGFCFILKDSISTAPSVIPSLNWESVSDTESIPGALIGADSSVGAEAVVSTPLFHFQRIFYLLLFRYKVPHPVSTIVSSWLVLVIVISLFDNPIGWGGNSQYLVFWGEIYQFYLEYGGMGSGVGKQLCSLWDRYYGGIFQVLFGLCIFWIMLALRGIAITAKGYWCNIVFYFSFLR